MGANKSKAEVWLFFPSERRATTVDARKQASRECKARDWQLQERSSKRLRLPSGRTAYLLENIDAVNVYRRMHRTRVGVLYVERSEVCLYPDQRRGIQTDKLISLHRYCNYKAFLARIGEDPDDFVRWISAFERWLEKTHCENFHDPRCLPFHVFATAHYEEGLNEPSERTEFNRKYGAGSTRTDSQGSQWVLVPRIFHGQEVLAVAGFELPKGFHWDVQGDGRRLHTPEGEWVIHRYTNVYPDAFIRGGKKK